MMAILQELFASKKFLVFLAGVLTLIASKLGLNLDPDTLNGVIALTAAYVVGQGIADHGKGAAQVNAALALKLANPIPAPAPIAVGSVRTPAAGFAVPKLLLILVAFAVVALGVFAVSCAQIKKTEANIIECAKEEAAIATKGTDVISLGIDIAAQLGTAAVAGEAAFAAKVTELIGQYGAPVVACVMLKDSTPAGGTTGSAAMAVPLSAKQALEQRTIVQHGWTFK